MTPSEWSKCCALLTRLWPHRPMPPESVEAWYALLADLDGRQVAAAIQTFALGSDAQWPPSVGQIRAAAGPARRPWEEAFAELRATAGAVGAYAAAPSFGDPALRRVVKALGWTQCCAQNPSDTTVRAQFRDAYRAAQESETDSACRELASNAADVLGIGSGRGMRTAGELLSGVTDA